MSVSKSVSWVANAIKYNNKLANLTPMSYFLANAFSGVGNTRVIIDGLENDDGNAELNTKKFRGISSVSQKGTITVGYNGDGSNWEFAVNQAPGIDGRNNVRLPQGQAKGRHWQPHSKKFNLSDDQFVKKTAELVKNLASQNVGLSVDFSMKKTSNGSPINETSALSEFRDVSRSYKIVINELTPDTLAECDLPHGSKKGFDYVIGCSGNPDTAYGNEGQDFFASNIYNYMIYFKDKAARVLKGYDLLTMVESSKNVAANFLKDPTNLSEGFGKLEHILANHYSNTHILKVSDVEETFGFLHFAVGSDDTIGMAFETSKNVQFTNRLGVFSAKQATSGIADIDRKGKKPFFSWVPTKKGAKRELDDFANRVINSYNTAPLEIAPKQRDLKAKMESFAAQTSNSISKTAVIYANEIDTKKHEKTLGELKITFSSDGKVKKTLTNVSTKKESVIIRSEKVPVMYASLRVVIGANALTRKLLGQNFEGYKYGMFNANPGDSKRHYKQPVVSIQFLRQFQFLSVSLDRVIGLEETSFFHFLKEAKHLREMAAKTTERNIQITLSKSLDSAKSTLSIAESPENLNRRWQSATLLAQGQTAPTQSAPKKIPVPITTTVKTTTAAPIKTVPVTATIKLPTTVKLPAQVAPKLPLPNIGTKALSVKGLSGYGLDGCGMGGYGLDGWWSSLGTVSTTVAKTPKIAFPIKPTVAPVVGASASNQAERTALLNFVNANRIKLAQAGATIKQVSVAQRSGKLTQKMIDDYKAQATILKGLATELNRLEQNLNTKNASIAQQQLKTLNEINASFDNTSKIISAKDIDLFQNALTTTVARVLGLKEKATSTEKDLLAVAQSNLIVLKALTSTLNSLIATRKQNKATAISVVSLETTLKAIKNLADAFAEKQQNAVKEIKETPITPTSPDSLNVTPAQADATVCAQVVPVNEEQAVQQQQAVADVVAQQVPNTDTPVSVPVVEAPTQVGTTVAPVSSTSVATDNVAVVPTSSNTTTTTIIPAADGQPAQVVSSTTPTVVPPTDIPAPIVDATSTTPQVAPPPAPEQTAEGQVLPATQSVDPAIKALEVNVAATPPVQVSPNTDTKSVAPATETDSTPKQAVVVTESEAQAIKVEEKKEEQKQEEQKAIESAAAVVESVKEENADKQPLIPIGPMTVRSATLSEEEKEVAEIKEALKEETAKAEAAKQQAQSQISAQSTSQAKSMSTGTKVAIGGAVVAALAVGAYFLTKDKE